MTIQESKINEVQQYLEQCYPPSACRVTRERIVNVHWQPYRVHVTHVPIPDRIVSVHSAFFDRAPDISDTLNKIRLRDVIKIMNDSLFITPTGIYLQDPAYGHRMPIHDRPHGIDWPPQSYSAGYHGPKSLAGIPLNDRDVVQKVMYEERYGLPHLFFETSGVSGVIFCSDLPANRLFLIRMEYLINNACPGISIGDIGRLEIEL